jgi:polyphosphate kinase
MTRDPGITQEVVRLFEFFRNNYKVADFRHLIVSPFKPRSRWRDLIRREVKNARDGKPAYVWLKLNNLADLRLIKELYEASSAGVDVRLIVRSMNSLIAGAAGVSERIEAISIVGRYLEHSRFMVFCNDARPEVFITSGDWLPRNFDGRIEVACPIRDPELAKQLLEYFQIQWADTDNARIWDSALSNQHRLAAEDPSTRNCHERIRAYIAAMASPNAVESSQSALPPPTIAAQRERPRPPRRTARPSLVIQC